MGDGNFHALLLFRDGDAEQFEAVKEAVHRMVERAQALEGTCTYSISWFLSIRSFGFGGWC